MFSLFWGNVEQEKYIMRRFYDDISSLNPKIEEESCLSTSIVLEDTGNGFSSSSSSQSEHLLNLSTDNAISDLCDGGLWIKVNKPVSPEHLQDPITEEFENTIRGTLAGYIWPREEEEKRRLLQEERQNSETNRPIILPDTSSTRAINYLLKSGTVSGKHFLLVFNLKRFFALGVEYFVKTRVSPSMPNTGRLPVLPDASTSASASSRSNPGVILPPLGSDHSGPIVPWLVDSGGMILSPSRQFLQASASTDNSVEKDEIETTTDPVPDVSTAETDASSESAMLVASVSTASSEGTDALTPPASIPLHEHLLDSPDKIESTRLRCETDETETSEEVSIRMVIFDWEKTLQTTDGPVQSLDFEIVGGLSDSSKVDHRAYASGENDPSTALSMATTTHTSTVSRLTYMVSTLKALKRMGKLVSIVSDKADTKEIVETLKKDRIDCLVDFIWSQNGKSGVMNSRSMQQDLVPLGEEFSNWTSIEPLVIQSNHSNPIIESISTSPIESEFRYDAIDHRRTNKKTESSVFQSRPLFLQNLVAVLGEHVDQENGSISSKGQTSFPKEKLPTSLSQILLVDDSPDSFFRIKEKETNNVEITSDGIETTAIEIRQSTAVRNSSSSPSSIAARKEMQIEEFILGLPRRCLSPTIDIELNGKTKNIGGIGIVHAEDDFGTLLEFIEHFETYASDDGKATSIDETPSPKVVSAINNTTKNDSLGSMTVLKPPESEATTSKSEATPTQSLGVPTEDPFSDHMFSYLREARSILHQSSWLSKRVFLPYYLAMGMSLPVESTYGATVDRQDLPSTFVDALALASSDDVSDNMLNIIDSSRPPFPSTGSSSNRTDSGNHGFLEGNVISYSANPDVHNPNVLFSNANVWHSASGLGSPGVSTNPDVFPSDGLMPDTFKKSGLDAYVNGKKASGTSGASLANSVALRNSATLKNSLKLPQTLADIRQSFGLPPEKVSARPRARSTVRSSSPATTPLESPRGENWKGFILTKWLPLPVWILLFCLLLLISILGLSFMWDVFRNSRKGVVLVMDNSGYSYHENDNDDGDHGDLYYWRTTDGRLMSGPGRLGEASGVYANFGLPEEEDFSDRSFSGRDSKDTRNPVGNNSNNSRKNGNNSNTNRKNGYSRPNQDSYSRSNQNSRSSHDRTSTTKTLTKKGYMRFAKAMQSRGSGGCQRRSHVGSVSSKDLHAWFESSNSDSDSSSVAFEYRTGYLKRTSGK